jgi:hypothetical protein
VHVDAGMTIFRHNLPPSARGIFLPFRPRLNGLWLLFISARLP